MSPGSPGVSWGVLGSPGDAPGEDPEVSPPGGSYVIRFALTKRQNVWFTLLVILMLSGSPSINNTAFGSFLFDFHDILLALTRRQNVWCTFFKIC